MSDKIVRQCPTGQSGKAEFQHNRAILCSGTTVPQCPTACTTTARQCTTHGIHQIISIMMPFRSISAPIIEPAPVLQVLTFC